MRSKQYLIEPNAITLQLSRAAYNLDITAVKLCLKAKTVNVEARIDLEQWSSPALVHAVRARCKAESEAEKRKLDVIRLILAHKANPNTSGSQGWRALHWANTPQVAELLIEYKANLEAVTHQNETPLMIATEFGLSDVVYVLLKNGANTEIKNRQGKTALEIEPFIEEYLPGNTQSKMQLVRAQIGILQEPRPMPIAMQVERDSSPTQVSKQAAKHSTNIFTSGPQTNNRQRRKRR